MSGRKGCRLESGFLDRFGKFCYLGDMLNEGRFVDSASVSSVMCLKKVQGTIMDHNRKGDAIKTKRESACDMHEVCNDERKVRLGP